MKKSIFAAAGAVFISLGAAVFFSGCASSLEAEAKSDVPVSKRVERERIDWKGASIGAEIPAWVYSALDEDYKAISRLPQFEGKVIFFEESQGKNLDLLKSNVNNFDVQGAFSRRLSNFVIAKFGGEQEGSKNDVDSESYLKEIVSTFSKTEINGLGRELDYWVKTRYIDNDAKTSQDIYQYFVVYGIDKKDLRIALDRALGLAQAKSESQKKMKEDVTEAILEAQYFAESEY